MREIKYKVWDKNNKRWLDLSQLFLNSEGLLVRPDDQGGYIFDEVDYQVVFFTGLKDKNGKEIFEGDIVKTKGEGTFPIEWGNVGCDYHGGIGFSMSNDSPIPSFYEVIGNIYENPKLLK